jgi:hypothetical protein
MSWSLNFDEPITIGKGKALRTRVSAYRDWINAKVPFLRADFGS